MAHMRFSLWLELYGKSNMPDEIEPQYEAFYEYLIKGVFGTDGSQQLRLLRTCHGGAGDILHSAHIEGWEEYAKVQ